MTKGILIQTGLEIRVHIPSTVSQSRRLFLSIHFLRLFIFSDPFLFPSTWPCGITGSTLPLVIADIIDKPRPRMDSYRRRRGQLTGLCSSVSEGLINNET